MVQTRMNPFGSYQSSPIARLPSSTPPLTYRYAPGGITTGVTDMSTSEPWPPGGRFGADVDGKGRAGVRAGVVATGGAPTTCGEPLRAWEMPNATPPITTIAAVQAATTCRTRRRPGAPAAGVSSVDSTRCRV